MGETSLEPSACKAGTEGEGWETPWLSVWGWKPLSCHSRVSYL